MQKGLAAMPANEIQGDSEGGMVIPYSSLRWTPIFPNEILRVSLEHPLPLNTPPGTLKNPTIETLFFGTSNIWIHYTSTFEVWRNVREFSP